MVVQPTPMGLLVTSKTILNITDNYNNIHVNNKTLQ